MEQEKIIINFYALTRSKEMVILLDEAGKQVYTDLMLSFVTTLDEDNKMLGIEMPQQKTINVQNSIDLFVKKYSSVKPEINQLGAYFKELKENEWFFVVPAKEKLSESISREYYLYLMSLDDGIDYSVEKKQFDQQFGALFSQYDIKTFGPVRIYFGESDKAKRVCRFCGKDATQTTYKKKAHTISKSLGNNNLVTNDECDACNETFGTTIEQDFIEYMGLFRTFYGLHGYSGVPKIKGKNFEFTKEDDKLNLKYYEAEDKGEVETEGKMNLNLQSNSKIKMQNIYRCLVKYGLSIMPTVLMSHFKDTIEWLFGRKSLPQSAPVAMLFEPGFFDKQPRIVEYIRKNDNKQLPYCVIEFHFLHIVMVAIVPFCQADDRSFTDKEDFDRFWKFFGHFSALNNWRMLNLVDDVPNIFSINLDIEERK